MTDDAIKQLASLNLNDPNAKEIMARICVPHAEGKSGAQTGVLSPAKAKYPSSKGKKPISSDEAIKRYREKLRSGGPVYPVEQPDVQLGGTAPEDLDPFTASEPVQEKKAEEDTPRRRRRPRTDSSLSSDRLLEMLLDRIAPVEAAKAISSKQTQAPVEENVSNPYIRNALDEFKGGKETVRMKLANGVVTMPCLFVQRENYAITVFMDAGANGFVFVPDSGTEVMLSWGGSAPVKAYFPGAQFTIDKLGISGMVFLSDPDEAPPAVEPARRETPAPDRKPDAPKKEPVFKFNPESGLEEDEFGLTKA